jgi:hypothetical protein
MLISIRKLDLQSSANEKNPKIEPHLKMAAGKCGKARKVVMIFKNGRYEKVVMEEAQEWSPEKLLADAARVASKFAYDDFAAAKMAAAKMEAEKLFVDQLQPTLESVPNFKAHVNVPEEVKNAVKDAREELKRLQPDGNQDDRLAVMRTVLEKLLDPANTREAVRMCVIEQDAMGNLKELGTTGDLGSAAAREEPANSDAVLAAGPEAERSPSPTAVKAPEGEVRFMRKRMTRHDRDFIWRLSPLHPVPMAHAPPASHRDTAPSHRQSGEKCYICKTSLERLADWHIEHVVAFSAAPEKNDVRAHSTTAGSCGARGDASRTCHACARA